MYAGEKLQCYITADNVETEQSLLTFSDIHLMLSRLISVLINSLSTAMCMPQNGTNTMCHVQPSILIKQSIQKKFLWKLIKSDSSNLTSFTTLSHYACEQWCSKLPECMMYHTCRTG